MTTNHAPATLRIGLAAARNLTTVEDRLATIERFLEEAASREVAIVCFPEAYLPGLRGMDFPVPPPDQRRQETSLAAVRAAAARTGVAVVIGMEWETETGILNVAFVIDRDGTVQGSQAKTQVAPSEDRWYVPGGERRLFEIDGVPFGIAICHEGWRYPETVRWAAVRGAKLVFHPHVTGSDDSGKVPRFWGDPEAPYYEKTMLARAAENEIWYASVNHAVRCQESATSLIDPDGGLADYVPYGEERLLVADLDLARATGLYAKRYNSPWYPAG